MIVNERTYNFAKRLHPDRLEVEVGNPINMNENYVRQVVMASKSSSGKTAILDQLKFGRM
jgi:hypothetical protein